MSNKKFRRQIKNVDRRSVDSPISWVADTAYFLTQIKPNFIEAPREKFPFLPFKYTNGKSGWLLMDFENVDSNYWNIRCFSIKKYCIKD